MPASFVLASHLMPVSSLTTVTATDGITAPVVSVTVPVICALNCPYANWAPKVASTIAARKTNRLFRIGVPPKKTEASCHGMNVEGLPRPDLQLRLKLQ